MTLPENIDDWISELAAKYGDAPALSGVDGGPISFTQLDEQTASIADAIGRTGVGPGDVVMVAMRDGPAALLAFLGAARGSVSFPVAANASAEEYRRLIEASKARAVVLEDRPDAEVTRVTRDLSRSAIVMRAETGLGTDPVMEVESRDQQARRAPLSADTVMLTVTSGTTATPKIVVSSGRSLVTSITAFSAAAGLTPDDRSLCVMPIAHLHSLIRSSLPILDAGGEVIWSPGFDRRNVLNWIGSRRPTYLSGAPAIFRALFDLVSSSGAPVDSLRLAVIGSDRVLPSDISGISEHLGARPMQFYGMTETSPFVALSATEGPLPPPDAVGPVNPVWSVRLLDENGRESEVGEEGEIALRGGIVNPLLDDSADEQRFVDGWFATGDLGRFDEHGNLLITGRAGDRISRGGEKIEPAAVESVIRKQAQVEDAAVFGLPDAQLGHIVAAVIVPESGMPLDAVELRAALEKELPDFAVPERYFIGQSVPRTAAGKIMRSALVDQFSGEVSRAAASVVFREGSEAASGPVDWVLPILRSSADLNGLGPADDYFASGGDSFGAVAAIAEIEDVFGISLSPAAFRRLANAEAIAGFVAEARQAGTTDAGAAYEVPTGTLVPIRTTGTLPPLFLSSGIDGQAGYALSFADALNEQRPIYTFHDRKLDADNLPSMEDKARHFVAFIREVQPQGPYYLAGHSFGAQFAVAMARELIAQGDKIAFLGVVDDEADLDRRLFGILNHRPQNNSYARNMWALRSQSPAPVDCRITFFTSISSYSERRSNPTAGWSVLAERGVELVDLPFDHVAVVHGHIVPKWIEQLEARLARADLRRGEDKPVRRKPEQIEARDHVFAAIAACKRGDREGEIASYLRALAIGDQASWVHGNLAEAYFESGDRERGEAAYRKALETDKWPLTTLTRFAPVFGRLGYNDLFAAAYALARQVDIVHPTIAVRVGEFHGWAGQTQPAEAAFRSGVQKRPPLKRAYDALAQLLMRQKRYGEAFEILKQADAEFPGEAGLLCDLGETLLALGRPAEAETVLRHALWRDESSMRTRELLERALTVQRTGTESSKGVVAPTQPGRVLEVSVTGGIGSASSNRS